MKRARATRSGAGLLGAGAVVLVLAACASPMATPRPADLAGRWKDEYGATVLRLDADGRCDADRLLTEQGLADGPGRWSVADDRTQDGAPVVRLDFSDAPGSTVSTVRFEVHDGGDELAFTDLATDHEVVLHR